MPPVQVRIVGGMPNLNTKPSELGKGVYAPYASDFYKLFRERGVEVAFEHSKADREYLSLHAAEWWIPILEITESLLIATGGTLISETVREWLELRRQRPEDSVLHVEFRVLDGDTSREFKANGNGADVLEAIDRFGEQWK